MSQNKIFIGNLPFTITKPELEEIFSQFGTIVDIAIPTDRDTGKARGFAFITFESQSSAQSSLSFDSKEISGRNAAVKMAKEKASRSHS